ncbi:MAG TPA: APC family permease [Candidatus Woesearchaeota archaeon]|nr:APC family permease [Candidatus Woesearchaeota archaeon]
MKQSSDKGFSNKINKLGIGKKKKLNKDLSLVELVMYGVGVMIGAGIYVLIGKASGIAGYSVWLSFILASVIAGLSGLSYAEMSSMFSSSSAEYEYCENSFNKKWIAKTIGVLKLATLIIGMSAVSLGFGGYMSRLLGLSSVIWGFVLLTGVFLLNLFRIRFLSKLNNWIVLVTILGLFAIIVSGVFHIQSTEHFFEFKEGFTPVFAGAALIFFAFLGFEDLVSLGEESKSAKKNMPKALVLSLVIVAIIYMLVSFVSVGVLEPKELASSDSPMSEVANVTMGKMGGFVTSIIALITTSSTVLIMFLSFTRMAYGISKKKVIPKIFQVLNNNSVPVFAAVLGYILCVLIVFTGDISSVAGITDFGALSIFASVNLANIFLRYKKPNLKRGFKTPLNVGKFPVVSALGLVSAVWMILHLEVIVIFAGMGIVLGIIFLFVIIDKILKMKVLNSKS